MLNILLLEDTETSITSCKDVIEEYFSNQIYIYNQKYNNLLYTNKYNRISNNVYRQAKSQKRKMENTIENTIYNNCIRRRNRNNCRNVYV